MITSVYETYILYKTYLIIKIPDHETYLTSDWTFYSFDLTISLIGRCQNLFQNMFE